MTAIPSQHSKGPLKRVVFISPIFPPTAMAEADMAKASCELFTRCGYNVHLLTSKNVQASESQYSIEPIFESWSRDEIELAADRIRKIAPEVVYIHFHPDTFPSLSLVKMLPAIVKQLNPKTRVVAYFPCGAAYKRNNYFRKALRFILRRFGIRYGFGSLFTHGDALITHCRAELNALNLGANRPIDDKVIYVPGFTRVAMADPIKDRALGRSRLNIPPESFVISFVGYLYPGKGIEFLLEAMAQLVKGDSNICLVLVGGDVAERIGFGHFEAKLKDLAKKLGISERVFFTGRFESKHTDGSAYLYASDVCVLPLEAGVRLNSTSLGLAARHGLPIICTRAEEPDDAIKHLETVYICEPRNSYSITEAINAVKCDATLMESLKRGSRKLADQYFDQAAIEATYLRAIQTDCNVKS